MDSTPDSIAPPPVGIVGAGPGDADLLTVKALRLIQQAEVVVYDRLVSQEILDLIPVGASRIFVGKKSGQHHMPQDEINDLLVKLGQAGRRTVRLKGGDPLVFGRGSEEAQRLEQAGVRFEIVPGISAAIGAAAYAGIPLTHRGLASSVRFVTGHCREDRPLELDWQSLADPDTTLVIYMGLANIDQITTSLMAAGLPGSTPAAAVEQGTTADQRRLLTTLDQLPQDLEQGKFVAPTLLIIGKVAAIAGSIDWFADADADRGEDVLVAAQ
jgi:uroporphyrin-III C-methyltransferase/precorrin-2 dehydrogenase/sirohydrochlorin ferrochelatase/uroporphyrin-III C-methyltransferase